MARKRTHFNEKLFGPYLYHGSNSKIPIGESVVPHPDGDGEAHATEDITYASEFGKHLHKVVPHDWSEVRNWEHQDLETASPNDINPKTNDVYQSFDSKKGYTVIGYARRKTWREGVVHPERKM